MFQLHAPTFYDLRYTGITILIMVLCALYDVFKKKRALWESITSFKVLFLVLSVTLLKSVGIDLSMPVIIILTPYLIFRITLPYFKKWQAKRQAAKQKKSETK